MAKKLNKLILNKAVQLLAQRDHSSYELTNKIIQFFTKKIKCSEDEYYEQLNQLKIETADVIQYCTNQNWMNDTQYIEKYIVMRANKGYGRYKIAMELKQRGLPTDLTNKLLCMSDINWSYNAHKQLLKKFKQINAKNILEKQRIVQFLITRGYTQDEIKDVYNLLT